MITRKTAIEPAKDLLLRRVRAEGKCRQAAVTRFYAVIQESRRNFHLPPRKAASVIFARQRSLQLATAARRARDDEPEPHFPLMSVISLSNAASRSSGISGFARCSANPAALLRARSSAVLCPLIAIALKVRARARSRTRSQPLPPANEVTQKNVELVRAQKTYEPCAHRPRVGRRATGLEISRHGASCIGVVFDEKYPEGWGGMFCRSGGHRKSARCRFEAMVCPDWSFHPANPESP